jgi:hypothetical protein
MTADRKLNGFRQPAFSSSLSIGAVFRGNFVLPPAPGFDGTFPRQ